MSPTSDGEAPPRTYGDVQKAEVKVTLAAAKVISSPISSKRYRRRPGTALSENLITVTRAKKGTSHPRMVNDNTSRAIIGNSDKSAAIGCRLQSAYIGRVIGRNIGVRVPCVPGVSATKFAPC